MKMSKKEFFKRIDNATPSELLRMSNVMYEMMCIEEDSVNPNPKDVKLFRRCSVLFRRLALTKLLEEQKNKDK